MVDHSFEAQGADAPRRPRVSWPALSGGRTSPLRLLTWASLVLLFCMALLLIGVALSSRDDHMARARLGASDLARLAASEVERRLDKADLLLLQAASLGAGVDWSHPGAEAAVVRIRDLADGWPGTAELWVVDPAGRTVASTAGPGNARPGLADRDFFRAAQAGGRGLVVGSPFPDRRRGAAVIPLARRMESEDGRFLGIVMVLLDGAELSTLLGSLERPQSAGLALYDQGSLLAGAPASQPPPLPPEASAAAEGTLVGDGGAAGGKPQILAWRRLGGLPAVSVASVPLAGILAGWRAEMLPFFLFGLLSLGGLTFLCALALRRARLEHGLQRRLVDTGHVLERMLDEKDSLLAEIHHRVKNNMQVIVSLVQMEAARMADHGARRRLDALSDRVALIGRIHERVYASGSFARMDAGAQLAEQSSALSVRYPGVGLELDLEPLCCGLETMMPLCLIAHELLDNALRHSGAADGRVALSLDMAGEQVRLTVRDDGAGPPEGTPPGLGTLLVDILAGQLEGTLVRGGDGCYRVMLVLPARLFSLADGMAGGGGNRAEGAPRSVHAGEE